MVGKTTRLTTSTWSKIPHPKRLSEAPVYTSWTQNVLQLNTIGFYLLTLFLS